MNTNYIIIDHVGSLTSQENKEIYNKIYALPKPDKDTQVFTMKRVCEMSSPFAKEITRKQKNWVRFNKHPRKVYLICNTYDNNVKFAENAWTSRGIDVQLFEMHPLEEGKNFDLGQEASEHRRIAEIWANAIGWTFSAPLHRDLDVNNIESFQERSDKDEINAMTHGKATKVTTSAEGFLQYKLTIATEEEVDKFYEQYQFYAENNLLAEVLEPDWILCPHCGKPVKLGTADYIECQHCDTLIESEYTIDSYYDTTNGEEDDYDDMFTRFDYEGYEY